MPRVRVIQDDVTTDDEAPVEVGVRTWAQRDAAARARAVALDDSDSDDDAQGNQNPAQAAAAVVAAAAAAPRQRHAKAWPPANGPAAVYTRKDLMANFDELKAALVAELAGAATGAVTKAQVERIARGKTTLSKSKWTKLFGVFDLRVRVSLSPTGAHKSLAAGKIKKKSVAQRIVNALDFHRTAAVYHDEAAQSAIRKKHKSKGQKLKGKAAQGLMSPDLKCHGDSIAQGFNAAFKTLSVAEQQRVAPLR